MTIKQRLAMFVIIAVVFILLAAGTGWFFFDYKIGKTNLVKDELSRISNNVIEGRVLEKRFLQFLDPKIRADFDKNSKRCDLDLQTLKDSLTEQNSRTHAESVIISFNDYNNLFNKLCLKIEENSTIQNKALEPILESRNLLKQMQSKISDKQLELQMEGEELDSNNVGLIILISECSAILFRLQSLQQQYLSSGEEKFLIECDKIVKKDGKELPDGMKQFSKIIKDGMLSENSQKISLGIEKFGSMLGTLKSSYISQQEILKNLDEKGSLVIANVELLKSAANDVISQEKQLAYTYICGVLAISIIVFVLTSIFIAVKITRPINEITKVVKEIAQGNLQVEITHESSDEIGVMTAAFKEMVAEQQKKVAIAQSISEGDFTHRIQLSSNSDSLGEAFNNMSGSLADVILNINYCAEKVALIAKRISDGSNSLSAGSVKSASSLEELSSSLNEIGSQVKSNAENAFTASKLASDAMNSANIGNERMQDMNKSMDEIKYSSDKISTILKVIEDIAFQTNLLALNAAVEAARAGRHGKGFAVVAEEVRNLAARSAKAVRETSELMEASSNSVGLGMEIAQKTATALSEIVETITKTSHLTQKISEASADQAMSVSQINIGLEQIDKVTQQNAIEAENSLSDSQNLANQADELQTLLSQFVLPEEDE